MRLRWIFISFFLIAGGVAVALISLALAWSADSQASAEAIAKLVALADEGIEPGQPLPISLGNVELALALTYACGAAFGGFFAARASPHKSYIEPAIAAALVVGSFLLVVYLTPMGKLLIGLTGGHLERAVSILAAVGIVSGLVGAVFGELASFGTGTGGLVRKTGIAILAALGALWISLTMTSIVYANELAERALANMGNPTTNTLVAISVSRAVAFAGVALACAAAASGFVSQLAARTRAIASSSLGAAVVLGGAATSITQVPTVSTQVAVLAIAGVFMTSLVVAAASAYLAWFSLGGARWPSS